MSQWARVQQNTTVLDQMRQLYPPHFTVEVRYYLCEWIEAQQWDRISENDLQHAPAAVKLLTEMLDLLQKKIKELMGNEHFIIRYNLEDCYHKIQNLVDTNPFDMIQTIKTCLANEKLLLDQLETEPQQDEVNDTHEEDEQTINDRIIMDEIQNLFTKTKNTETDLKHLQQKQETFIIQFSDGQRITGLVHQLSQQPQSAQRIQKEKEFKAQKDKIDILLTTLAHDLFLLRIELSKKYEQTILSLQKVQQQILDNKLISWKRQQQLAGNGLVVASSGLETLQKWCDDLADLIWQNRQQIKKSTQLQQQLPIKVPDSNEDLLPKLNETITTLLSSLVTSTFIVVQQPPQVLKKDARFSASVSLLVGGKLNIHMNPPHVKATIISEHQASDLLKLQSDCKVQEMTSGEILNNSGLMEYQAKTGHLGITFRNMQLKKIKRAEKRGSEAVTDEKFCILFQSKFSVGGSELIYQVWTLSLPVVVTVHGNQECNASATVLWDNGFAEPGRLSFEVPDSVEWNSLADQLNTKFKFHTGKGLTKTNLDYLASKLFGKKDPSTCKVSWAQFSKDTLPNRNFTFWDWFYAIQKLTKEHIKDQWADDTIIGFVSKNLAQSMLIRQPLGTFLLRFSDSEIGGITIAWTGEKEVLNLAPFVGKDFNIRGLPDRIRDVKDLVNLFPNKPKDEVFSKYYTSTSENVNVDGYIRPVLMTTLPQKFTFSKETEIKQPFSQESSYDVNLNSVQNMDDSPYAQYIEVPDDFIEMEIAPYTTDYRPEDIDEINIEELISNHQLSG